MNGKVHTLVLLQMVVLGVAIATVQVRRSGSTVGVVGATIRPSIGLLFATGATPPTAAVTLVFVY